MELNPLGKGWTVIDCLSKQEAARRLDVHPHTLDNWAKGGEGPPRIKAGRRVLYPRAALEEWISTNMKAPAELQLDEGHGQGTDEGSTQPQNTDELWIEKWLAVAPPMTDQQKTMISRILGSAGAR